MIGKKKRYYINSEGANVQVMSKKQVTKPKESLEGQDRRTRSGDSLKVLRSS